MRYSEKFKEKMVEKLIGPGARSANALSKESGVPQSTLSGWLRQARMEPMSKKNQGKASGTRVGKARKRWSSSEKIRVVMEAAEAGEAGLGELLRREGLYEETLAQFREEVLAAAQKGFEASRRPRQGMTSEESKIHDLEKELARKEKALAEAAVLLVLQKKVQALFPSEEEGRNTNESNE